MPGGTEREVMIDTFSLASPLLQAEYPDTLV